MEQIKNLHRSLSDIATDSIRNGIIRGEFKMGQAVTEAALSLSLNISKTPVREALSKLESEGLVVSEKNKGYRIFTLSKQEYIELSELRFALESQALRYGFERDLSGMIEKLELILENMSGCLLVSDREIYQSLDLKKESITKHTSFEEHKLLLELLVSGNIDETVSLLERHIVDFARASFVEPEVL